MPESVMPELAELLARLRRNEIGIPAFLREAEKLPEDEWRKLSALIMQWFAQRQAEGSSGPYAEGEATKR
jgi:hypothetical protein